MQDVELIQKELSELTGMKAKLGSPQEMPPPPLELLKCPEHPEATVEVLSSEQVSPTEIQWTYRCSVCGKTYTLAKEWIPAPPAEDERLRDLERQIAEAETRLAELKSEIAELEAKVGWTPAEEAERARLQRLIDEEEANIAKWQSRVSELNKLVPLWKARLDTAKEMLKQIGPGAIVRFSHVTGTPTYVEYYDLSGEAGLRYLDAWGIEAIADIASMGGDFRTAAEPVPEARQDITIMSEDFLKRLMDRARNWGETIPTTSGWWPSKHDFRIHKWKPEFIAYITSLLARSKGEAYWKGLYGVGTMAWIYPSTADKWRSGLLEQREKAETTYHSLYTQLRDAKDELERTKRRLWDAKAAKERYELAITRAIALRQAEVEAAKARHELELRTLDNLKATYNALLKEIEAARTQAIAEAARQREEVIKAKEEDRLSIAEEQRKIAEKYEKLAAESAGIEREEYLDKMRRALDIAKDAEEAAIAAAKEREALAVDIATRKAELARIELDLEELRKQLAITAERKEEAEKEIAGLPAIPKWGWIALGVGGITATAGGIAYAVKKKKKKRK